MPPAIAVLCRFFRAEIPRLKTTYDWPIPPWDGFTPPSPSGYRANIELKQHLTRCWANAGFDERIKIAKYVVRDWGGVRANRPETLLAYVKALDSKEPSTLLAGVASYSKLFSIADPEKFAIYDARVAACLNAVQLNAGLGRGLAFNYIPGRNNIVGNWVTDKGFTRSPRFSVKSLCASGWTRIERRDTYARYLQTLSACLEKLSANSWNLVDLEMALFANAESQCAAALARRRPI